MTHFKKALPLILLPLTYSANAVEITANLTFDTLPVITIVEETQMDFGEVLTLAQSETCTLSASVAATDGTTLADGDSGVSGTTPDGGALTGTCALAAGGQPGVYTITSGASADIKVSVTAGAATEIAFNPIGVVYEPDGTTSTLVDVANALGTATASAVIGPVLQAGQNRLIMGGVITNQTTLIAGDAYDSTFDVEVTYQ